MRVFVTGASGFVGGHVVAHLAAAGHEVRAMARSAKSAELVRSHGAEPVRCDLDQVRGEHVAGCGAVIHAAARAEEWGTREEFWTANVDGTQRMLDAAREGGVRRFVHVGTEAAIFDGHDLVDVDEDAPYPPRHRYLYSETKAEAERRVLAASDRALETISIRPRLVWGPRDASVLPAVLRMHRDGSFAWLDGGRVRTSTTHVRNVAHALELALTRGTAGRAYFVADEGTRTIREFLAALVDAAAGEQLGARSVPSALMRPLAHGVEGAWRALGIRRAPPMTRFAIDMMSSTVTVRTERARAELGYLPVVSVEQGLAELRALRGATEARGDGI
ncbi:MAG: NAD-dependent epimerase/dehydratase family protein [Myxococcota bacterium]|nr:NAD-dependent epimerase/dehydratase family protein [Myxococcota bacterium]